jgi:hypothetical protein
MDKEIEKKNIIYCTQSGIIDLNVGFNLFKNIGRTMIEIKTKHESARIDGVGCAKILAQEQGILIKEIVDTLLEHGHHDELHELMVMAYEMADALGLVQEIEQGIEVKEIDLKTETFSGIGLA